MSSLNLVAELTILSVDGAYTAAMTCSRFVATKSFKPRSVLPTAVLLVGIVLPACTGPITPVPPTATHSPVPSPALDTPTTVSTATPPMVAVAAAATATPLPAVTREIVAPSATVAPTQAAPETTATAAVMPGPDVAGDPEVGAVLFLSLPCSGCHGATAGGQFGPTLAGTGLTFEEVRRQVRMPRDKMPRFDESVVSDEGLRHIYAWLRSLARPTAVPTARGPAEATAQARDRRFPEMDAATLTARMEHLDEVALRVNGHIVAVEEEERYTQVRLRVGEGESATEVVAIYDTFLARQPFPADEGDQVTVYAVGAVPIEVQDTASGTTERLPHMQILHVAKR